MFNLNFTICLVQIFVTLLTIIFIGVMDIILIKLLSIVLPVSIDNEKLAAIQSK
ncbi:ammonium transport protein [Limosilactobacillus reuteri I5007]|uniref:Ammonium transport protein n=1 Tax=Limosilactobacillus reuteri I5007 TaxID=1340495 RepID=R9WJM4_LIMRT|nr:ammonium transport protein [Limosilactobacillus reuteri I5007]